MHTNDPKDPLEGKGEEMIPDRGIPFDDIEDSAPQITHADEWEPPDSAGACEPDPEAPAPPEALESAPPASPEMEASIMGKELPASTNKEYTPMEENTRPPEDTPDDGMGTALEEVLTAGETPPEMQDGGMSAGYPPVKDNDLPPEPSTPVIEPEPESMQGALLFYGEGMEISGPSAPKPDDGAPGLSGEVIADEKMVDHLVSPQSTEALWARAGKASEGIEDEINNVQLARQLFDQIKFARHELLGGKDHYEDAERHINEAEFRVSFAKRVGEWSKKYGIPLFIYELVCGVVLIGSLFFTPLGAVAFASGKDIALQKTIAVNPTLIYLLACMIWGGFGGVIGALLSLVRHISEDQDFDKQFSMWYLGSPWMGMGVGIAVYLFMHTGMLSLLGSDSSIASPIIIYVLAWLAGYQHNIFTEIVRRMMRVFRIESEEEEKKKAPPAPTFNQQDGNMDQTPAPQKPPDA